MARTPTRLDGPVDPPDGFPPDPDAHAVALMSAFVMERWRERAAEMRLSDPIDLSGSCRFSTLFVQSLHGGSIRGYNDHFHVRLGSGLIVDLNAQAADVQEIRRRGGDPYWHHRAFMASRDVRESFDTCRPRVQIWTKLWLSGRHDSRKSAEIGRSPAFHVDGREG